MFSSPCMTWPKCSKPCLCWTLSKLGVDVCVGPQFTADHNAAVAAPARAVVPAAALGAWTGLSSAMGMLPGTYDPSVIGIGLYRGSVSSPCTTMYAVPFCVSARPPSQPCAAPLNRRSQSVNRWPSPSEPTRFRSAAKCRTLGRTSRCGKSSGKS